MSRHSLGREATSFGPAEPQSARGGVSLMISATNGSDDILWPECRMRRRPDTAASYCKAKSLYLIPEDPYQIHF